MRKLSIFLKLEYLSIDGKNKLIIAEIHNEVDLTLHEFVDSNPEICLYKVKLFLIIKGHTPLFLSISNVLKEEEYIEEYLNEFMYGW